MEDADIRYRSPGEDEVNPGPHGDSHCWDSVSRTPPDSGNCSQNQQPSSPCIDERGFQSSSLEDHREASPRMSPTSPFTASPSFPSSPLASALRLFEGVQRRQRHAFLPTSPTLKHQGCSLAETRCGLRLVIVSQSIFKCCSDKKKKILDITSNSAM